MIKDGFFGMLIDPLTKVLGPLVKMFLNSTLALWSFIKPIMDFVVTIGFMIAGIDTFIGILNGISEVYTYVFGGLEALWSEIYSKISPYISSVSTSLQGFGKYIGYAVGVISFLFIPVLLSSLWTFVATLVAQTAVLLAPFAILAWSVITTAISFIAGLLPGAIALAIGFWAMLAPILPLVLAIVAVGVVIWYFWDSIVKVGEAMWEFFKCFSPLVIVFDLLVKAVGWVIKKMSWFSEDESSNGTKGVSANTWNEMFSNGTSQPTEVGTNTGNNVYQQAIKNVSDLPELRNKTKSQDQNVRGGNNTGNNKPEQKTSTSVTNNIQVDGVISNKQSVKFST
jgi:hypothetical protein